MKQQSKKKSISWQPVMQKSICLAIFAFITASIITISWLLTHDKIKEQQRLAQQKTLIELVADIAYDNNILDDTIELPASDLLGTSKLITGYLVKQQHQNKAVVFPVIAPNGYNGAIELLVAVYTDGTLAAVRVTRHNETPSLGDKISLDISAWILVFTGMSLNNTNETNWQVKKDGGIIDQFVGATITPRAVVAAVYNALKYFNSPAIAEALARDE